MAVDILLAVFQCVATIAMGYLGVHVTLHPTEDPQLRKRYKLAFLGCGSLAVFLILMQTIRNAHTQASIRAQLATIERNTKSPPTVSIQNTIPPVQVISGEDSREKVRRKAIREHLGKLLREGERIREGGNPVGEDVERKQWEQRVERYLKANLDSSYVDRWKASIPYSSSNRWQDMWGEVDVLSKIIVELK